MEKVPEKLFGEQTEARDGNPSVFSLSHSSLLRHFHGYPSSLCLRHVWSPEETRENTAVSEGPQPIIHSVGGCNGVAQAGCKLRHTRRTGRTLHPEVMFRDWCQPLMEIKEKLQKSAGEES